MIPPRNAKDYSEAIKKQLPTGRAWNKEPDSVLSKVVDGLAPSIARTDSRANDLLRETNIGTTSELLEIFEATLGLPDPCLGIAPSVAARRAQAVARWVGVSGQTVAFYTDYAKQLGSDITITEFTGSNAHKWTVNAALNNLQFFRANINVAGDPLGSYQQNTVLECEFNNLKPAHTIVNFSYTDAINFLKPSIGKLVGNLAPFTLVSSGNVASPNNTLATLSQNLKAFTLSGAGGVRVGGTLVQNLAPFSLTATASVVTPTALSGTLSKNLAAFILSGAGTVAPLASTTLASGTAMMPDPILSIDAALPRSTSALVAGVPGIMVDAQNNVLALIEPISKARADYKNGQVQIRTGGAGGFPYFFADPNSPSYDALDFDPNVVSAMFASPNAAWTATFVMRQTGGSPSALLDMSSHVGSADNALCQIKGRYSSTGKLSVFTSNGTSADEPDSYLTALGQWQVVTVMNSGNQYSIYRNGIRTILGATGTTGGIGRVATFFRLLNNGQGDFALIEINLGAPNVSELNARTFILGQRYGIAVNTVVDGLSVHVQPGASTSIGGTIGNSPSPTPGNLAINVPNGSLQGTFWALDANLPASFAVLDGTTPGIQLFTDPDGGTSIKSTVDAWSKIQSQSVYGASRLITTGGPNGFPFLRGDPNSPTAYHSSWDSFVLPGGKFAQMFSQPNTPWALTVVMRQTGGTDQGQLLKVEYSSADTNIYFGVHDGDGRYFLEQNHPDSADRGREPQSSLTVLNQWQVVTFICTGNTWQLWRNGVLSFETTGGLHGGFYTATPSAFCFMNNAQADVACAAISMGAPSIAQHNAYTQAMATRYGIAVQQITTGFANYVPAPDPDTTLDFLSTPNYPLSDSLPTRPTATPGTGITLQNGATQIFSLKFGSASDANVTTSSRVRDLFYFHFHSGDQGNAFDYIGSTGHPENDPQFWAVGRHYAPSSPNDLHQVRPNGFHMRAISSNNRSQPGFKKIWSAVARLPTIFLPGSFVKVRYKIGRGPNIWPAIWFASGEQLTPLQFNSTDYYGNGGAWLRFADGDAQGNHFFEFDLNDGYSLSDYGAPNGRQLDSNTPWQQYGVSWTTPPYIEFPSRDGNGNAVPADLHYGFTEAGGQAVAPVSFIDDFRTIYMNWRSDGTRIDYLMDVPGIGPKVFRTCYIDYSKAKTITDFTGQSRKLGMHMLLSMQPCPLFNNQVKFNPETITDQDGFYGVGDEPDGWSAVFEEITAYKGELLNPTTYR